MRDLVTRLNQLCDGQPFQTHWYLKNLRSGEEAHRSGDTVIYGASTRKISIMMALLAQHHDGHVSLDQPFVVEEKYQKAQKGGVFAHLTPGFEITLYDALVMMIIVSDNTCSGAIADMIGLEYINDYCDRIGMTGTTHRQIIPDPKLWSTPDQYLKVSNTTTANDVGHLLNLIVMGSKDPDVAIELGSTPELCALALEILGWQRLGKLGLMLPSTTKVGSKTGTGPSHHHDAGVVYDGDESLFILAAYTVDVPVDFPNGPSGKYVATTHVANLCRLCWDGLLS